MSYASIIIAKMGRLLESNESPEIGTIYCAVDGYSEANSRYFYQVIKKTDKSVIVQQINQSDSTGPIWDVGYDDSIPYKNSFRRNSKPKTSRIKPDGWIKISTYLFGKIWNGDYYEGDKLIKGPDGRG